MEDGENAGMIKKSIFMLLSTLLLTSCGLNNVETKANDCGFWTIVENPWNGSRANVSVVKAVAEQELGCRINTVLLSEGELTYTALESNQADVVLEDWGLGRWQPWVDKGSIVEVGQNGIVGFVGMFVAPWMVQEYPDILDYNNLNKYSELFVTSESNGKGAWYEGDPSYITIGEKLISANSLNYKFISAGSETALVELIKQSEADKKPLLTYFAGPHPLFAEMPELKNSRVKFPKSNWLDAADADGTTDYPDMPVYSLATPKLMNSDSSFANLIKNFQWSNEDQDQVSKSLVDGLSSEEAAQKWINSNKDKVKEWISNDN
jgi:glycine betaine/proline transport system substrate-binding protein